MPVYLKPNPAYHRQRQSSAERNRGPAVERRQRPQDRITIGLINNMADAALEATERQFVSLLNGASEGISIDLALYSLPGVPRSNSGSRHVDKFYSSADTLWDTHLDGLIVTGREPLSPDLRNEPYWESFTKLLEWAQENTFSSVWSCLAAHAAVLHMDGIRRIRSTNKHFGVFECENASGHPLAAGTSTSFKIPHSRWNGMPEEKIRARGYHILTCSADVGVDTFLKQNKSLLVFFQGHPEYESKTLLLEYRRDVGRFLKNETDRYPLLPRSYFHPDTEMALTALQQQSGNRPPEEILAAVTAILDAIRIDNTWHKTAVHIYRNWLQYIRQQKKRSLQKAAVSTPADGAENAIPELPVAEAAYPIAFSETT